MRLILRHFFIMSVIFSGCVARQGSTGQPHASEDIFTASDLDRVERLIRAVTCSREHFARSVSRANDPFVTNHSMAATNYDDMEPLRGKLQRILSVSDQPLDISLRLRRSGEWTKSTFRFDPGRKELVPFRNTPQANSINIKVNPDSTWLEIGSAEVGFFAFSVGGEGKIIYGGPTIIN